MEVEEMRRRRGKMEDGEEDEQNVMQEEKEV